MTSTLQTKHNTLSNTGITSPLTIGQVYTTNTTSGQFLTSSGSNGMSWTTGTTTTPSLSFTEAANF